METVELKYQFTDSAGGSHEWVPADIELTPMMLNRLERFGWERISANTWRDSNDGEMVDTRTLLERFGQRFRSDPSRYRRVRETDPSESITREHMSSVQSYLIETQRLRMESGRVEASPISANRKSREKPRIRQLAEALIERLAKAQTEHSRITQKLDRTFPNRVLQAARAAGIKEDIPEEQIRKEYAEQSEFRSRIGRVASVELEDELPLLEESLGPWDLALLALYVDDTKKKLEPFREIIEKIDILEDIINRRLLGKSLAVTSGAGLEVTRHVDGISVELESLSSGEQHEIILMTELLFEVNAGTLVLIDEPEISLHVAWQLAFIPDVLSIANKADFRFLVATHSPQIINEDWDKATRLGPEGAIL